MSEVNKRAVILSGGKGTRLRPYTVVLPKPLMPLGDYPILEVVVRQLARNGFGHITMAVNHQADLIKAFFGNGSKWGVRVDYSLEDVPLGTMGPLRLIQDLPEHFLVLNGDVLTDLPFGEFYDRHVAESRLFTIASHAREQLIDYGVLQRNEHGLLCAFSEKPRTPYEVSMGIYMAARAVLDWIPPQGAFGFDSLMRALLASAAPVVVEPYRGYWLDIGRPEDYEQAIDQFEQMKRRLFDG